MKVNKKLYSVVNIFVKLKKKIMRKLFLLVVIVMAAITASAQEGIYLGGGISLWRNNDVDKTSFSITPDVGYNLSENGP